MEYRIILIDSWPWMSGEECRTGVCHIIILFSQLFSGKEESLDLDACLY